MHFPRRANGLPLFVFAAIIACPIAVGLVFCDTAEAVTKLVIVAGQSNADGLGPAAGLPASLANQPDVLYWYDTRRGFSNNSFRTLTSLSNLFGPELALGRTLADELEDEIAIVKVTAGGAPLAQIPGRTDWSPSSPGGPYSNLISHVTAARNSLIADGKQVELAGMFWMQGETDGKSSASTTGQSPPPQPETANAYQANLTNFILQTRTDLNVPELPFFVGQINIGNDPRVTNPESMFNTIYGEWNFTPTIQAAQAAVAIADPNVHLIDTSGFSHRRDVVHFDQQGQIDLGNAFANSYLLTIPEPSSSMLLLVGLFAACVARSKKHEDEWHIALRQLSARLRSI